MCRTEGRFGEALLLDDAGVEHQRRRAARVRADDVFLPLYLGAAVGAVEVGFIAREVAEAEVVVAHCEVAGREGFVVGFPLAGDVARAPAAVDQFPFAVVDLHCVPGVVAALCRYALAWRERCMPVPFTMSAHHDTFHARFSRQRSKETSIAFADCETGLQHRGGRGGFDGVVEEGDGVVGDIVVEPGEDRTGFICGRREGGG